MRGIQAQQGTKVLIPPAASPLRRDRELQTVSHAALVVQHCQLVLHRLFGYAVPSSDLTIRQSFQNRTEQLPLSTGEVSKWTTRSRSRHASHFPRNGKREGRTDGPVRGRSTIRDASSRARQSPHLISARIAALNELSGLASTALHRCDARLER